VTPGLIDRALPLIPLKRISPSRYGQLRACALREIWTIGGSPSLLPRNPAAILGIIAHQLLKEAGQGDGNNRFDPVQHWKHLIDAANEDLGQSWLEAALSPLERSGAMYEVLRIRACARADQIACAARSRGAGIGSTKGIGFELWVESHDKSVGGWIDAARRIKGSIVLSDFKSGEVLAHPEGIVHRQLKDSHCIQLKLYAALYFQTYGIWPTTIRIVPLNGANLEVPFTQSECNQLLDEARQTLKTLNACISNGLPGVYDAFAAPSPQNCRFCSYRPACGAYRKLDKHSGQTKGWPTDAFGQVWDMNVLRDGRINLLVAGDQGEKYVFRALSSPATRHPALKTIQRGDRVGIFNARVSADRTEFSEGMLTILYRFAGTALAV
jgi:PD-(D/E)XK nuclease superfamily